MPWQKEYAIEDTFDTNMVFVPRTPACVCKLFRVQHDPDNPTHELAQVNKQKCVLVPLGALKADQELTFNYFGREEDLLISSTPETDSSTCECSQSLSAESAIGGSQVVLTGNGVTTSDRLYAIMEKRFSKLNGEEVCESLAF